MKTVERPAKASKQYDRQLARARDLKQRVKELEAELATTTNELAEAQRVENTELVDDMLAGREARPGSRTATVERKIQERQKLLDAAQAALSRTLGELDELGWAEFRREQAAVERRYREAVRRARDEFLAFEKSVKSLEKITDEGNQVVAKWLQPSDGTIGMYRQELLPRLDIAAEVEAVKRKFRNALER